MSLQSVDFPPPEGPTRATVLPGSDREIYMTQNAYIIVIGKRDIAELHFARLTLSISIAPSRSDDLRLNLHEFHETFEPGHSLSYTVRKRRPAF